MRKRCSSILVALFAFLSPLSNSVFELGHGIVHEHADSTHLALHASDASTASVPTGADHDALHNAPCRIRISHPTEFALASVPSLAFREFEPCASGYSPAPLLDVSNHVRVAAGPRAPPVA